MSALSLYLTFEKKFKIYLSIIYWIMVVLCLGLTSMAASSFTTNWKGDYTSGQKLIYWGLFGECVHFVKAAFFLLLSLVEKLR